MSASEDKARSTPAYIPLKTLENFSARLKDSVVPAKIDSSVMANMSGGMASALTSALRFLRLIDANGAPTSTFKRLVQAHGTSDWASVLSDILDAAYQDIVGDLDVSTATSSMLDDCFKARGELSGQMLEKATRFYLSAYEVTGRPISPHLTSRKRRAASNSSARKQNRRPLRPGVDRPTASIDESEAARARPDLYTLKLPVPFKGDVTVTVPADITGDDWKFVLPMISSYMDRYIGRTRMSDQATEEVNQ